MMDPSSQAERQMLLWKRMFLAQCAVNVAVLLVLVAGGTTLRPDPPSVADRAKNGDEATFHTVRARRFIVIGREGDVLGGFAGMENGTSGLVVFGGPKQRSGLGLIVDSKGNAGFHVWRRGQQDALAWTFGDRALTFSLRTPGNESALGLRLKDKVVSAWVRADTQTRHWQWRADGEKTWADAADTGQKTGFRGEAALRFMKLILEAIRGELESD